MKQNEDFKNEELELYSRQIVLPEIGYNGQKKLKNAKVCIVGLGGLGSPVALQLASMGVGYIRLIDFDIVELSNLQRQYLFDIKSVDKPKVEVASQRLLQLNPYIKVEPMAVYLNEQNAEEIIRDMDVVVDGLDNFKTRYAINSASQHLGIPYIFGSAIQSYGNVVTIIPGKTPCLECFYGNMDDNLLPKCATAGVSPIILSIIASIEVSEVIRVILGEKPLLAGQLLFCDSKNLEFEKIEIKKMENCPICDLQQSNQLETPNHEMIMELCSRKKNRVFVISHFQNLKLDINELNSNLGKKNDVKVKTSLSLTFYNDIGEKITIFESGVAIIQTKKDAEYSLNYYRQLLKKINKNIQNI